MLDFIRLILDTCLFILIWLVQLLIYPSFLYYQPVDLLKWHEKYTQNISYIVIPLMIGQLGVTMVQLFQYQNTYTISSFISIAFMWIITFSKAVPLHHEISQNKFTATTLKRLVNVNWWRTVGWTLIFGLSLYFYLSK